MQACPLRALERPLPLVAFDKTVDMPHLQLHPGLAIPAVLLALEEVIKKALLQCPPVIGIEMRPVLEPMRFQPFVARGRAPKVLEIAARMTLEPDLFKTKSAAFLFQNHRG